MVKFSKRSTAMKYWTDFNGEPDWTFYEKIYKKHKKYTPKKICQIEELAKIKKNRIIEKLVPVMSENRKKIWINLPISATSEDLVVEIGLSDTFINDCE